MKKYFIIAVSALVAMCACTKTEVSNIDTPDQEITFEVASYVNQTKADYSAFNGVFYTYAWQNPVPTANAIFMNNEKISKTDATEPSSAVWKPAKAYYWPKTGGVDFVSYAAGTIDADGASTYTAQTTPWATFTATSVAADKTVSGTKNEDWVYADKAVNYNGNATTYYTAGVPTLFHHALAQVAVNVVAAGSYTQDGNYIVNATEDAAWIITLKKADIKNVYTAGTLNMGLETSSATGAHVVAWDAPDYWTTASTALGDATLSKDSTTDIIVKTEAQSVRAYKTVLPQKFVAIGDADLNQQYFDIEVKIESFNKNGSGEWEKYGEETITMTPLLSSMVVGSSAAADQGWERNTKTLYTIVINPCSGTLIYFDPAVEDWTDETPSTNVPAA